MNEPPRSGTSRGRLRQRAEELLRHRPEENPLPPMADVQSLIHELQIYQTELEMQNEELRRAQVEVTEARDRLTELFDFAPVGYLLLDREGAVQEANLAAAGLLGLERSRLRAGGRLAAFVHRGAQDDWHLFRSRVLEGRKKEACDLRLRRPDGATFVARVEGVLLDRGPGATDRLLVAFTDISELKRREGEIARLNEELRVLVLELEAANRELEAFNYSVSHDLRTPLRTIAGFAEALREDHADQLDAQGMDFLRRVYEGSLRMGELIQDLLQLSRLSRQELRIQPVDLGQLARQVAEELGSAEPERRVRWSIGEGPPLPGDPQLLRIVIGNLLGNAWKFTSRCDEAQIEFGSAPGDGGRTVFYVRDNGSGFDMAYADKLFVPFQRLHTEQQFPGTGIGLATVRRIVHRHGGRVWAEGSPGGGAAFYFEIGEAPLAGGRSGDPPDPWEDR